MGEDGTKDKGSGQHVHCPGAEQLLQIVGAERGTVKDPVRIGGCCRHIIKCRKVQGTLRHYWQPELPVSQIAVDRHPEHK